MKSCIPINTFQLSFCALLFVSLIVGCSKKQQEQTDKSEKSQSPSITDHAAPPTPEQSSGPEEGSVGESLAPEPSSRDIEQAANAMGVPKDQVLSVLRRQQVLWNEFKAAIQSDNASRVVPMLLAMSDAVRGTPLAQTGDQRLPDSFLKMLGHGTSSVPGLEADGPSSKAAKAGFMDVSTDRLAEQRVLAAGARELAKVRPDLVTSLANERAKALPPTAADYILFNAITDGLAESPFLESTGRDSERPNTLPYGGELLALAKAPNPIYRLLAVRTARYAERDKAKLVGFYSQFLDEPDPFIQAAAVDGLAMLRASSALTALQSFEARARQKGNADLERAAKLAIQQLTDS
jgi:hypothetical protein